ncbi:HlyD family secretion protein [Allomuricauda sp. SCSIO 65647]|uniref:HlyD family secretion protein n=1 Tax=Allomuricauda sp. SCSIO 65647 TaxID=2908843 RepID=UPI001F15F120|nr:HlyD family efflux transporter periplasmic adaptor subunit [Muricauda sp. SCSIO 65647]UJH67225.1 HlyD family secretion protein [Muricauda sp. SCSIO 65647]
MSHIFPKEIVEFTSQAYIPKNKVKSRAIYTIILTFFILALFSLPFLTVKIFSSARGAIRPDTERTTIVSINSGKVLFSKLVNNRYVQRGEVLLRLENHALDDKIALTEYETQNLSAQINDLYHLINDKGILVSRITSGKYQKEWLWYQEELNEHLARIKKLKVDHQRNSILLQKGVIAKAEYDNVKLDYDLALNSLNQLKKRQLNTWQATLTELENSLSTTKSKKSQLQKTKKEYTIAAPMSGTLVNVLGIQQGSVVSSGVALGEISPDSHLLADCYVSPVDIGLIKKEKPVNFQLDAYNYNQWGLATGQIIEISEDVELIDDQPVFRVRCKINEKYLELRNGAKGKIKKGMTFNARFELTERTLYQLLYDEVDDWVNPSRKELQQTDLSL